MKKQSPSLRLGGGAILLGASAVLALMMACGDSGPNNVAGLSPTPNVGQGACATPNLGCACVTPGQTAPCGHKVTGDLNFVYCYEGTRTCQATGTWGDCEDGTVTTKSLTRLHTAALGTTPTSCSGGLTGTDISVCVDGKHKGDFCTTNADCANGERKCSGGTDSTTTCKDNSECQVSCSEYNGHCTGGTRSNQGCNATADCTGGGTCTLAGGTPLCGTFSGICDSSGADDGDQCTSSTDCPTGTCTPPKFGVCIGGSKNGKKCKVSKHCKGGGTCSNGAAGDAGTGSLDPCDPFCNVFPDTASGVDAGAGFIFADGGLTTAGCGDGTVVLPEACDDGNTANGDGCSSTCKVEPGYYCPIPGVLCLTATCGNGIVEGLEQCDDTLLGFTDRPYDGCFKCKFEVKCPPGGPCTPKCGDGIVMGTEQCDDGNTISGDGCDSLCVKEAGSTCVNTTTTLPTSIDVPVIYRDFAASPQAQILGVPAYHPDFQATGGVPHTGLPGYGSCIGAPSGTSTHTGIMKDLLGADGEPEANTPIAGRNECNVASVNEWYRDSLTANRVILGHYLRLFQQGGPTSSTYRFDATTDTVTASKINCGYGTTTTCASQGGFWPINTEGWGSFPGYSPKNFHFTSEVHFPFTYKGGEVLAFEGDDDVFVYVAGRKVVDLGGIHGALPGSTTLANSMTTVPGGTPFTLTVGQTYDISVFQAERNTSGSNYKLTLQGFTQTTSVCTQPAQPQTFVRDYQAVCGPGTHVVWQLFQWKAAATATATIDFRAATSTTQAGLPADKADSSTVAIGQANATSTAWRFNGYPSTPVPVSTQLKASGQQSQNWLRVYMTFTGAPVLSEWQMLYDCIDAE